MTLNVGDKVVMVPLRGGGLAAVRSGEIAVGDKVVVIPGKNGERFVVKPATPAVGDRVIVYPLRNGQYVCLASADESGGSSPSVLPPANFSALRSGPSTATLKWALNSGNTAVRIVRRPDRYPTTISDGSVVYEGAATSLEDSGLDFRSRYYYCAWGKAGSRYSNGYLTSRIGWYGYYPYPSDHDIMVDYAGLFVSYGDDVLSALSGGCEKITASPQYGSTEYAFGWPPFEAGFHPDDMSVCVRTTAAGYDVWVCAAPYPRYGASGSASVYLFGQLVWSGSLAPAIDNPGYILCQVEGWTPL